MSGMTIGEALVAKLRQRDVTCVFGIPGVHTVELYRGLAASGIRHITPRHEQGAGFMADGYARVSGKPGVTFVITGPGLTNTLTPMAQARADSIPMLVVSGVNKTASLGKGLGHLHELPDQLGLARTVALVSEQVPDSNALDPVLDRVFHDLTNGRPGPVHIEVPLDVAAEKYQKTPVETLDPAPPANPDLISQAARQLAQANRVVILAGGGAKKAETDLQTLAETLDAPVVQTVNARGLMHGHPLTVPASPSLKAVRELIESADCVLALGTELGPTDYDMYATEQIAGRSGLIRVDRCSHQLARHEAALTIQGDVNLVVPALFGALSNEAKQDDGAERASKTRRAAWEEIGPDYRHQVEILNAIRSEVPNALMVGDSTQPIYAGNLFYDHDRAGGWFNAATGYGALGYGIPAAIGASIADPTARAICIVGDGGAQFSLPEIMAAADENLPVTFVIWNNHGYQEIAASMRDVGVTVIGCDPSPPNFSASAKSFGIPFTKVPAEPQAVAQALRETVALDGPAMIEVIAPKCEPQKD
ncbi:5-guanidino-2-oxopentanoate decarboxylase (plasmid) [Ruegeria sp. SCSIO 43209]|uniref:5-guanidino-2-oxopentanoate decarboxylase n=1 Tax=Ruegeria sp. SCSIO 43209 TaxID=2793010 RepID=UPI001CA91E51|nr:5-guanidino-2-oxopentanoate decarboxylase [Ruegeria sp. SCSIO 43209]UAB91412.1 5-guanidino-2-oxopentanoate decarboxylase [Ruegeria sp. SCSIO 43209]